MNHGTTRSVAALAALVAVVVVSCAPAPHPKSPTAVRPRPSPSIAALPVEIAAAIDFRTRLGMRADEAFVRELAANPDAVTRGERSGYGVPMTEWELSDLRRRVTDLHDIATIGRAYGLRHPEVLPATTSTKRTIATQLASCA